MPIIKLYFRVGHFLSSVVSTETGTEHWPSLADKIDGFLFQNNLKKPCWTQPLGQRINSMTASMEGLWSTVEFKIFFFHWRLTLGSVMLQTLRPLKEVIFNGPTQTGCGCCFCNSLTISANANNWFNVVHLWNFEIQVLSKFFLGPVSCQC